MADTRFCEATIRRPVRFSGTRTVTRRPRLMLTRRRPSTMLLRLRRAADAPRARRVVSDTTPRHRRGPRRGQEIVTAARPRETTVAADAPHVSGGMGNGFP